MTADCCHRGDGQHPGRHGEGAIHPGHLPAQLPVGPRATRPGEPRVPGPGLAGRGGTRRRAPDHPGTICETYGLAKRAHATTAILRGQPARGQPGSLRRGQRAAHHACRQPSIPTPWCRPPDQCPLLHHHPPAKSLHNLIEAIPEDAWTPIPYWMDGAADVAETTCTPFRPRQTPRRYGSSSGG